MEVGYYLVSRPFPEAKFFSTWFLWYVFLDNTSSKLLLFIFLLDETEMAQNNSVFVFVWKTSNNSHGGPNLIIDMNQVTNLKSLGFYMEKIGNWLGVSTSLWSQYFCNRPFCGRRCCKLVFVSVIAEADDSPGPTRWSFLLSPPVSLFGEQSFYFLLNRWLLAFINQLFAIFAESINDFTVSFQWRKYWLGFKFAKNISDIEIIRRGENSNFGDIFVGYMYT